MTQEQEVWMPIAHTNGGGEVSNFGRIRNAKTGYILKLYRKPSGYYCASVGHPRSKTFSIARTVAEAFIPNPDNKPQVNHKDCVKGNNLVTNLEWVTAAENTAHAEKFHGRRFGARAKAKIKAEHVIAARALARAGVSIAEIARNCGVGMTCIHKAVRGQNWKHINSISQPVPNNPRRAKTGNGE